MKRDNQQLGRAENGIMTLVEEHKSGLPVGIPSICSSNEYVIKAALLNAKKYGRMLLIESTSNQVDQYGGYTGMTPTDFKNLVFDLARDSEFPEDKIVLGGDHLGPNVWQRESSASAMGNAEDQIRAYVSAGYSKIHLDTSMKCADDGDLNVPLDRSIVADRAAQLCKAAEEEWEKSTDRAFPPVYVIGPDVPPPGGAKEKKRSIRVTPAPEMKETIDLARQSFSHYHLEDAWKRVVAIVVQPGVEFGDEDVFDYEGAKAADLKREIEKQGGIVFEAHSTDFQLKKSLKQMVEDHFAILKVGPWLTFAFREAVFALEMIEREILVSRKDVTRSRLTEVIESRMKQDPRHWDKYYKGDDQEVGFKRKYSLSDRIRYYWNDTEIRKSLESLLRNISAIGIPLSLISQFLPESFIQIRTGEIKNTPESLILNHIMQVLDKYDYATMGGQ